MAYVKKKRIKGREYYYLAESYRVNGKVRTRTLAYLGKTPEVPDHLAHHLAKTRRRNQKLLWDPQALESAITRNVCSKNGTADGLGPTLPLGGATKGTGLPLYQEL